MKMNDDKWSRIPEFPVMGFVILVLATVLFAAIKAFS